MTDTDELRWRYLKDCLDHSRHHETLRAIVTNLIVAVCGAAFAVIGFDKCITVGDRPLLLFIALLGGFGTFFAASHTERSIFYYERARHLRAELDKSDAKPDLVRIRDEAERSHNDVFTFLSKQQNRIFWYVLPASISVLALVLIVAVTDAQSCRA